MTRLSSFSGQSRNGSTTSASGSSPARSHTAWAFCMNSSARPSSPRSRWAVASEPIIAGEQQLRLVGFLGERERLPVVRDRAGRIAVTLVDLPEAPIEFDGGVRGADALLVAAVGERAVGHREIRVEARLEPEVTDLLGLGRRSKLILVFDYFGLRALAAEREDPRSGESRKDVGPVITYRAAIREGGPRIAIAEATQEADYRFTSELSPADIRDAPQRSQLRSRLPQIALAHDRVTPVHGLGLVSGHLHRDGARDVRPLQVPDRGAPKIMKDTARHAGVCAGRAPRPLHAPDRFAFPVEHPWNDSRLDALAAPRVLLAPLQERARLRRDRKRAPLAVLRGPRLEPHEATGPVHLGPREGEDLGLAAPARLIAEAHQVRLDFLETPAYGLELPGLEEPGPDIVLA